MQTTFRASWPVLLSFALGVVLLSAEPAAAQLTMCNRSAETVSIAVGYADGGQTVSHGWYVTAAGECAVVVAGPLRHRYYYVRGEGRTGTRWEGDYSLCATDTRFSYRGSNCAGDGLEGRRFFVVDTGSETAWTHALTGRAEPSAEQSAHDAIAALRVSWRPSLLEDGSMVMVLHNNSATTVDVTLTCHTTFGTSSTMVVRAPGYGTSEVGFLQGWAGNFVAGESCEAYHGRNELMWRVTVPRAAGLTARR